MAGLATISKQIAQLESDLSSLSNKPKELVVSPLALEVQLKKIADRFTTIEKDVKALKEADPIELPDIDTKLKKLKQEFLNSMPHGAGNANRNIQFNGQNLLTPFTDINYKAGSNITFTVVANQTTKYMDVTVAATGGGGSVGGVVRSISTIATSQTAGNAAGIDYVYICSAGVQLTLPDATTNTNLYTVKNTSNSSVMVSTTSAQTIDGQSNAIMPIQFTSIDLISDGSNWDIT